MGNKKKNGGITKAVQKKIDAWWTKNSDALVETSVKKYNCKEDDAKDVVKAYQQFLQVKREMEDWENKLLPCHQVLEMMESHIGASEDFDYQSDMKFICGHDFEGRSLVVYGTDDDIDREKATYEAVRERFQSNFNETLWNTAVIDIYGVEGGTSNNWNDVGAYGATIEIHKSEPLESAFEKYVLDIDHPDGDLPSSNNFFQFLLCRTREVIDPNDTVVGLGLIYSDQILALHKDATLIEVKKKGLNSSTTRLFCAAGMTETMTTKLNDLVNDNEEDETDYVFMFKDKRIYGFETPMALQMKHFDVIDAIPSQDYKCERCVCCNNADRHVVEG